MYTNAAYLGQKHEDIVDRSKPLLVTATGYFRVHSRPVMKTDRPNGREDYQLLYVASGKIHLMSNGQEKVLSKGTMILFRPKDPQVYYQYASEKPETYWVHFTGSDVDNLLEYYGIPKNENIFFTGTAPDYQWLFRQMIQELQLHRVNYDDLLNLNLRHMFLVINRYLQEGNTIGTAMLDEVERATHYFNDHYREPIVIEDYAAERMMTANWFTQIFKKITKVTPMQYIISLRITDAMNLIDNSGLNMTQIAAAVGYDNSMYFSRLFKKHTGMTPSEYKKRNEKANA